MALHSPKLKVVLLDVDGVLLDHTQWEQEWARLAGPAVKRVVM